VVVDATRGGSGLDGKVWIFSFSLSSHVPFAFLPPRPPSTPSSSSYIGVIVYGFNLGAVQAFARSAFGAMIPEGLEAQFFSLYNVTDRGSSWIGPAVISAVINSTGTIRLAFIYPLVMLIIPSILLQFVNFPKAELEAKAYAKLHGTAILATRGALSVALAGNTNETGTPVVEAEGGKGAVAPAAPLAGAEGESAGLVESARQAEQQQQQA
jgi:hypothetical protein